MNLGSMWTPESPTGPFHEFMSAFIATDSYSTIAPDFYSTTDHAHTHTHKLSPQVKLITFELFL